MKKLLPLITAVALLIVPGCGEEDKPKPQPVNKNAPATQPKDDGC